MTPRRRIILLIAALNIVLILLFPPFDTVSISRGTPRFDAFYFALGAPANKIINADLLFLQLCWVAVNVTTAWLMLGDNGPRLISARNGAMAFTVVNLTLVLLFPPFENYSPIGRASGTHFDGFFFAFGDKAQRNVFLPLLYIEALWILINGAVSWLVLKSPVREIDKAKG